MPGELTSAGSSLLLAHLINRTLWVGLYIGGPSDTAFGTELVAAGYARQAATFNAPAGDPVTVSNNAPLTYGPFTANPPNITHVALLDVSVGGTVANQLWIWTLETARDMGIDDSGQFGIGALTMILE